MVSSQQTMSSPCVSPLHICKCSSCFLPDTPSSPLISTSFLIQVQHNIRTLECTFYDLILILYLKPQSYEVKWRSISGIKTAICPFDTVQTFERGVLNPYSFHGCRSTNHSSLFGTSSYIATDNCILSEFCQNWFFWIFYHSASLADWFQFVK